MKRIGAALALCAWLALCAGCQGQPAGTLTLGDETVAVQYQADASAFAKLDVTLPIPAQAADLRYAVLGGDTAQAEFALDGARYTYRASRKRAVLTDDADAALRVAETIRDRVAAEPLEITVRRAEGGLCAAGWQVDDVTYCLLTDSAPDSFDAVALQLGKMSRGDQAQ